jgi:hypothetical protein
MKRISIIIGTVAITLAGMGGAAWAQFAVFDPVNYANALLRYAQLQQQYVQLVITFEQIRTQYQLLKHQANLLPVDMNTRYRSKPTPWLQFIADNAFGTTAGWIRTANNGHDASVAYTAATQPLLPYGGAMAQLPAEEGARVQARYDRVQLSDASITHGLEALGFLRGHQESVEYALESLEDDTYSDDPELNTQIALLNKINATAVASTRLNKDANNVLVSLLEQQLLEATERREAAVQGINAHIAFETDARPLLAATTAETTTALTTFRIP